MEENNGWNRLASDEVVENTAKEVTKRGIETFVTNNAAEAKAKLLEIIPKGSQVFNLQSITLSEMGVDKEFEESGSYDSVRKKISAESDEQKRLELRKGSLAPKYAVGSANALTEQGELVFGSASGSQIAVYSYGAEHVIWVVSTQKIVKDLDAALKRIREYVLPLESERLQKAIGMPSNLNKLFILEKERPQRATLILVKEKLGF